MSEEKEGMSLVKKVVVGVVTALLIAGITVSVRALDKRWNQCDTAITAESNSVQILELTLQSICEKYRMNYPCSTGPMNPQDQGRYDFYMDKLKKAQQRLDRKMGRG